MDRVTSKSMYAFIAAVITCAMAQEDNVVRLRRVMESRHVPMEGVCAVTIHKNRATQFSSLIFDSASGQLLPVCPALQTGDSSYREMVIGDFRVCYQTSIPVSGTPTPPNIAGVADENLESPFCCDLITPYKPTRTARDAVFEDFRHGRGHHPNILIEVKRQVNNGPMMSTRYFTLEGGTRLEVPEPASHRKLHSYKNYKCPEHDRFFGVDLLARPGAPQGNYNFHHMRMYPYTEINQPLLDEFFSAAE
ncbi:unnamed protein product (mitochondrion) [Plasmodiophora brassicae]|uniref:Uncharacterized protein n=2 Tax=Plasmodiophora brassicae TaxID=37360 RepID=A0A3P3Y9P8_PLABS|nr:unnamed protein product [Plasmodiophora brassicae]